MSIKLQCAYQWDSLCALLFQGSKQAIEMVGSNLKCNCGVDLRFESTIRDDFQLPVREFTGSIELA